MAPATRILTAPAVAGLVVFAATLMFATPPASVQAGPDDGARVVAQRGDESVTDESGAENGGAPALEVFADLEKAWNAKDVNAILEHFGKKKVAISVVGTGPSGGEFSRSQSYYLLKDLFRYTTTRRFEFVQFRKPNEDGRSTFAVAERDYLKADDGRLFSDKIYVSLHIEGKPGEERWVIDEIKSIR